MPSPVDQPVVALLHAEGRERREPGTDAAHRRAVSQISVLRLSTDGPPLAARRHLHRPPPGSQVDAIDGAGGDLSGSENQRSPPGTSDLPVSAGKPGGQAAQSGLVCRHHLHPREPRLFVSGRDHGLGDTPCSVLAAVEHHGCLLLRRGFERGAGPIRQA